MQCWCRRCGVDVFEKCRQPAEFEFTDQSRNEREQKEREREREKLHLAQTIEVIYGVGSIRRTRRTFDDSGVRYLIRCFIVLLFDSSRKRHPPTHPPQKWDERSNSHANQDQTLEDKRTPIGWGRQPREMVWRTIKSNGIEWERRELEQFKFQINSTCARQNRIAFKRQNEGRIRSNYQRHHAHPLFVSMIDPPD